MKRKILAVAVSCTSVVVACMLLFSLFTQNQTYAAYVRSLPTKNAESVVNSPPTWIPGVVLTGDYLCIGVNEGGTLGVGNASFPTGFQYPIGTQHESVAFAWWGEGYTFAYKTEDTPGVWVDHIAYWQPDYGWPPPAGSNIEPLAFRRVNDDSNFAHYLAQVRTTDGALVINFRFMFAKHMKYVTLYTEISVRIDVKDLIYKRFVDWDIHRTTANDWSTDSHSVYASYYNETSATRYVFTISGDAVTNWNKYMTYAEAYGWDDITSRAPGLAIQSHETPITLSDLAAMITFDLGNGNVRRAGSALQTTVYYQAGENWLGPFP